MTTSEVKTTTREKAIRTRFAASLIFSFLLCGTRLFAQPDSGPPARNAQLAADDRDRQAEALEKFKGAGFGVGITLTVFPGRNAGVKSAEIINGIVRISEVQQSVPRLMIETHYFFTPDRELLVPAKMWGWGPFLGIQNGSEEIVESIGAGLMIGFRRASDKSDSFNIGVGGLYDTNIKTLGDGLTENTAPPAGETTIRFKKSGKWAWVFAFSFGF